MPTASPGEPLLAIDKTTPPPTTDDALAASVPIFFQPVLAYPRGPGTWGQPATRDVAGVPWTRRTLRQAGIIRSDVAGTGTGFVDDDPGSGYGFFAFEPDLPWGAAGTPAKTPRTAVIVSEFFWSSLAVFGQGWSAAVARAFAAVYPPLAAEGIHVYVVRPGSDHCLIAPMTGPVPIDSGEEIVAVNTAGGYSGADAHSLTMRGEGPFAGGEVYWCYLGNYRTDIGRAGTLVGGSTSAQGGAYVFLAETLKTPPPSPPVPFGPTPPPPGLQSIGTATEVSGALAARLDTFVWPDRMTHDGNVLLAARDKFAKLRMTFAYRDLSREGFFAGATLFPGTGAEILAFMPPAVGVVGLPLNATPATAAAALAADILNFFTG